MLFPWFHFKRIIKDYFLICESYQQAVQKSGPAQIEAIDMGRRGLHDEGSELLISRMEQKNNHGFPNSEKIIYFDLLIEMERNRYFFWKLNEAIFFFIICLSSQCGSLSDCTSDCAKTSRRSL